MIWNYGVSQVCENQWNTVLIWKQEDEKHFLNYIHLTHSSEAEWSHLQYEHRREDLYALFITYSSLI